MGDYVFALKQYGLSENEIKVFVALLKLGESNVHPIAKTAELPRTTTYHLLESLNQKELVSYVLKDSKKYFSAVSPNFLTSKLEEKKKLISEVLPTLNKLRESVDEKPQVQVYEGVRGIKNILQDILEERKEIFHYGDIVSLQNSLKYIFPQFITQRVKKKIPIKIIARKESLHKDLIKSSNEDFRQFKFSLEEESFDTGVFIYGNKVAILNLKTEPYYGILIENESFYNTQKSVFNLMWNNL